MKISKKEDLKDKILSRITDYDIFRYYLGNIKLNKAIKSPFGEKDDHPSMLINVSSGGQIFYKDTRYEQYKGDCFRLVMQLYGLDFVQALNKIGQDFGILEGNNKWELIKAQYQAPEKKPKKEKVFEVDERPFTSDDLAYWKQYLITEEDLRRENIISLKAGRIDGTKLRIGKDELAFAYQFGEFWKLYFPLREKGRKWLCNVPLHFAYRLESLDKDHDALVCKSLKDYMVCTKVYPYCCGVQNESLGAISQETADTIMANSKRVFYGGDSDEPGKKQSRIITSHYPFLHINPPDWYAKQGGKDWADMAKLDGNLKAIEKHFKKKGLL